MHTATVAQPGVDLGPATDIKKIAVIGGGPAGLETARIAAVRGHKVALFEQGKKLGGQLALWAAAPSMGELGNIIRWRIYELDRLGVAVNLNQRIEKADFEILDADIIVIASGSKDFIQDIPGEHSLQTVTPHALLRGESVQATKAIVINEGRGQAGLAAAEVLVRQGISVEIITSDIAVAADIDPTNRTAWYSRLGKRGCIFTAAQTVVSADDNRILCRNIYDDRTSYRGDNDLVLNWQGCRVDQSLNGLTGSNLFYIGDCVAPRNVEIAIAEADALANKL